MRSLRSIDLRKHTDDFVNNWMEIFSHYGGNRKRHGKDLVIRRSNAGVEYFFSPRAYRRMKHSRVK
jgi:hypothetical protein